MMYTDACKHFDVNVASGLSVSTVRALKHMILNCRVNRLILMGRVTFTSMFTFMFLLIGHLPNDQL